MSPSNYPGEFEQMVLLTVLRLGHGAFALAVLKELDVQTGRRVSRGSIYKTLDRMEAKGLVRWRTEEATPERGGHPRRLFEVTPQGVQLLKTSRNALFRLWNGLDPILGDPAI